MQLIYLVFKLKLIVYRIFRKSRIQLAFCKIMLTDLLDNYKKLF